jgi:hypothetical protein
VWHRCTPKPAAASAGPTAPSMFDEDDEKALPDVLEEEDGEGSGDDAFIVAKPQVCLPAHARAL